MNTLKIIFILSTILFFSACSQKVQIRALSPAEVGEMANKKNITISAFKNDNIGLSGKIESRIASQKLNGKRYFNVVSRKNIQKVLDEQKLQGSEAIDELTTTRAGKIIGAQAIVNGEITSSIEKDGKYSQEKKRCKIYDKEKKQCLKYEKYFVKCNTTNTALSANLNIVDVETASIIHSDSFNKKYEADSCKTSRKILNSKQATAYFAEEIANEFASKLTPSYTYYRVSLLEEIEFDASNKQNDELENALNFIKAGRMDKAEGVLNTLLDEFDGKSYVIAYNLGVVKEAQGRFNEGKNMYLLADEISMKPIDEINFALTRINRLIDKNNEAMRQINAK